MKKSKLLLAASIIGTLYLISFASYFTDGGSSDLLQFSIAIVLLPHMTFVGFAVIFNWIGWAMNERWAALVAGILYSISILLMIFCTMFVVLEMIFCFVAFSKMKHNT